jgi:hypothetical protein
MIHHWACALFTFNLKHERWLFKCQLINNIITISRDACGFHCSCCTWNHVEKLCNHNV